MDISSMPDISRIYCWVVLGTVYYCFLGDYLTPRFIRTGQATRTNDESIAVGNVYCHPKAWVGDSPRPPVDRFFHRSTHHGSKPASKQGTMLCFTMYVLTWRDRSHTSVTRITHAPKGKTQTNNEEHISLSLRDTTYKYCTFCCTTGHC